jgi:hypothetical protein
MSAMPYTQTLDSASEKIQSRTWVQRIGAVLMFLWRWTVGVIFTQAFFLSIFVVGWTYRLMQRYAVYRFIKLYYPKHAKLNFHKLVHNTGEYSSFITPPNWFNQQNPIQQLKMDLHNADTVWQSATSITKFPFHSLWLNFKIGFLGLFNTYALTLIPCLLWQFAWHAGWNNSFNKIYEQAHVGALTGLTGIFLFSLVMMYVPMAQVRQAVTGEWKTFYHFQTNWRLIRSCWFYYAMLALLFSIISIPVTVFKTAPGFFVQGNPALINATDAELLQLLNRYFFFASFFCFAGFVIVRLAAVRVYVTAVKMALHRNLISLDSLTLFEQNIIQTMGGDQQEDIEEPHMIMQVSKWMGRKMKAAVCMVLIFVIWVTFSFQIYVSEFLNYHPSRAWLNQPLVQMPAFRYVPSHLSPDHLEKPKEDIH